MYKWLLILCFALVAFGAQAIPPHSAIAKKSKPLILAYDSVKFEIRSFNKTVMARYRKEPAFNYIETTNRHKNAWERFWEWFWNWLARLFQGSDSRDAKGSNEVLRYILIATAVILLIVVVIKYIGADVLNALGGGNEKVEVPYSETLENIHEINFDEDIDNALSRRNYRLAVRLLYLRSLKQLNDAGLIDWQIEKTNATYVNELSNADQRQTFSILTRQFENVWYGDFPVNEQAFKNINTLFQDFKKIIV